MFSLVLCPVSIPTKSLKVDTHFLNAFKSPLGPFYEGNPFSKGGNPAAHKGCDIVKVLPRQSTSSRAVL